jgi:hypothetical protein
MKNGFEFEWAVGSAAIVIILEISAVKGFEIHLRFVGCALIKTVNSRALRLYIQSFSRVPDLEVGQLPNDVKDRRPFLKVDFPTLFHDFCQSSFD